MKKWVKLTFAAILMMSIATTQVAFAGAGEGAETKSTSDQRQESEAPIIRLSRELLEEQDRKSPNSRIVRRSFLDPPAYY